MIFRYRSYHFFLFRPLCFISPFPRFISSPRAAPAKVASLLISPRAQSAMSPRSQGGCNCELQKKEKQMISSTTVVLYTQTESGRLTLKSVCLPEVRTWYVIRIWLRLPMRSCYLDIARLWWIVIICSGGDEPFKYKSIWLSGSQVVRDLEKYQCLWVGRVKRFS